MHRADPTRRGLVEIVDFYAPDYLARKLALVREERLSRLVLGVNDSLGVADEDSRRTYASFVSGRRFRSRM